MPEPLSMGTYMLISAGMSLFGGLMSGSESRSYPALSDEERNLLRQQYITNEAEYEEFKKSRAKQQALADRFLSMAGINAIYSEASDSTVETDIDNPAYAEAQRRVGEAQRNLEQARNSDRGVSRASENLARINNEVRNIPKTIKSTTGAKDHGGKFIKWDISPEFQATIAAGRVLETQRTETDKKMSELAEAQAESALILNPLLEVLNKDRIATAEKQLAVDRAQIALNTQKIELNAAQLPEYKKLSDFFAGEITTTGDRIGEARAYIDKALSGEIPIDSFTAKQIEQEQAIIDEQMFKQFGNAGGATSTPAQEMTDRFLRRKADVTDLASRRNIETGRSLLTTEEGILGQNTNLYTSIQNLLNPTAVQTPQIPTANASYSQPKTFGDLYNNAMTASPIYGGVPDYTQTLNILGNQRVGEYSASVANQNAQNQMWGGVGQSMGGTLRDYMIYGNRDKPQNPLDTGSG